MPSNYPPGAEYDPNAPYNETTIPDRDFDVKVTETLSRVTTVTTNDYIPEVDDESGHVYADTSDTDWGVINHIQHLSIEALITRMSDVVKEYYDDIDRTLGLNLAQTHDRRKLMQKKKSLEYLIKEAEGWETEETNVEY